MGKMTRRGKSGVKVCAFINKTNLLSRDGLMARDSQECIILYFLSPNKANALNGCVKDNDDLWRWSIECVLSEARRRSRAKVWERAHIGKILMPCLHISRAAPENRS
jgi:hypothetical protein